MKCQKIYICISAFYTDLTVITINVIVITINVTVILIYEYDFRRVYISLMMVQPYQNPQWNMVRISCERL